MKMKGIFCVLLTVAMTIGMTACSAQTATNNSGAAPAADSTTKSDFTADSPEDHPAAAADTSLAAAAEATEGKAGVTGSPDSVKGSFDTPDDTNSVKREIAFSEEGFAATDVAPPDDGTYLPPVSEPSTPVEIQAAQLTAGEWNDNDNWGFFTNLVNSGAIAFPSYGLDPLRRTAVTVTDQNNAPAVNVSARLLDQNGKVIWSGVTNKKGIVYLFEKTESKAVSIELEKNDQRQSFALEALPTDSQGNKLTADRNLSLKFEGTSESYKNTDIMFILDTTGSMSDEMLFLQSEFSAIAEKVGNENTRFSVNFYRDEGDEYITRTNDFTSDIPRLQQKLNSESADGGGDMPEAVAEILHETMSLQSWRQDAVKLAFLIFDAPPHAEKEAMISEAVQKAADQGIRLIPVVSSNSERDTELFARAIAIQTGGTYIFLTDDSGIGDSHLEPIIGDYKVEKLYDLIIRVINDYRQ